MSRNKLHLLGKKGEAEIIKIFAAVSNTDTQEGRGQDVDVAYYRSAEEADVGCYRVGVSGAKANVGARLAVQFDDGTILLLAQDHMALPKSTKVVFVTFSKPTANQIKDAQRDAIDKRGLSKLTPAEKKVLGL